MNKKKIILELALDFLLNTIEDQRKIPLTKFFTLFR